MVALNCKYTRLLQKHITKIKNEDVKTKEFFKCNYNLKVRTSIFPPNQLNNVDKLPSSSPMAPL